MQPLSFQMIVVMRCLFAAALLSLFISVEGFSDNVRDLHQTAVSELKAGHVEKAIELLQRATELQPESAPLQNHLGLAYLQKSAIQDAILAFERALEIDPDHAEAHSNLATAYASAEREASLVRLHFERAIELQPSLVQAYVGLGWLHMLQSRDIHKATELFEQAVELDPENIHANYSLGLAYALIGKHELAIKPITQLRKFYRDDLAQAIERQMRGSSAPNQAKPESTPEYSEYDADDPLSQM